MIQCPRCGGQNVSALSRSGHRRPRIHKSVVVRHHHCADCAMEFCSYQIVIRGRAEAEAIMDALGVA